MFEFLKKLKQTEKEELLNLDTNVSDISISLNTQYSNQSIVSLYKELFEELASEDFGVYKGSTLHLTHKNIYTLFEDERASMLMLPSFFNGNMIVTHRGFLDSDASFDVEYVVDDRPMFGIKVLGSILKISEYEQYLLPQEMYKVVQLIKKSTKTNLASDRYTVVEYIQLDQSSKVYYKGLKENDFIHTVDSVGINVDEKEDGSLELSPLIRGLSSDFVKNNEHLINSHDDPSLLLTQANDGKINRYILNDAKLSGAKKIINTATIPKEQAKSFKRNPEAFLEDFTEEEIDVSQYRLNRIVGLTTEVYVGFFGSEKLETPISQVLKAGRELVVSEDEVENVNQKIENLSPSERVGLEQIVQKAIDENQDTVMFDGEEFPVSTISGALNDFLTSTEPPENRETTKDLMLDIENNDGKPSTINGELKDPNDVDISFTHYEAHWQNIIFEPKNHQVQALNWMISLYKNRFPGGLLADDMGLGKTFQIISFMNYLFNLHTPKVDHTEKRILIVAPTILLSSWKNEIDKFVREKDAFRVKILKGRNQGLVNLRDLVKENGSLDVSESANNLAQNNLELLDLLRSNVYITTYETLNNYQLAFAQQDIFQFEMVVFDEAQKIKNPSARISRAAKGISSNIPFSMIVTGTPIENELRDLWSLLDTMDPVFIGPWKDFRKEFVQPLSESSTQDIESKLHKKISNYMLRRMKQDHLEGLPSKEFKYIEVMMNSNEVEEHNNIINSSLHHMDKLQKLRLLSLHPSLIGLDKTITPTQLESLTDKKEFFKPSKMQALVKLLDLIKSRNDGEKVLIFIIRRSMQTLLQAALKQKYGISVDIINGDNNTKEVTDRKLESFSSSKGFGIMILSPLSAGVGLTITAANNVIHFERHWNPAKEDQASDRVYRIGQDKDVNIYHLVHEYEDLKTFDKGLNQLISNKKALSNGALIPTPAIRDVEFVNSFFGERNEEEQLELMNSLEFEIEIKRLFEIMNYRCHLTTNYPRENGADVIAMKNENIFAIQCKHTSNRTRQNHTAIYQLIADARTEYPDAKLVAVTNFYFNKNAKDLAKKNHVILIELNQLVSILKKQSTIEKHLFNKIT